MSATADLPYNDLAFEVIAELDGTDFEGLTYAQVVNQQAMVMTEFDPIRRAPRNLQNHPDLPYDLMLTRNDGWRMDRGPVQACQDIYIPLRALHRATLGGILEVGQQTCGLEHCENEAILIMALCEQHLTEMRELSRTFARRVSALRYRLLRVTSLILHFETLGWTLAAYEDWKDLLERSGE